MPAHQEVELKFELKPGKAVARRLREQLEARFGPGSTNQLTSTYFDTPDLALRKAAVSLRLREGDGRRLQTIKARSADARSTLFARDEWEVEIAGEAPDLTVVPGTALEPLLEEPGVAAALRPAFRSIIERTVWIVSDPAGEVELAFDQGAIRAGSRSIRVSELELELKGGRPAALIAVARSLEALTPLRLAGWTKADRGYQLLDKGEAKPAGVQAPALTSEATAGQAFQAIARNCLQQFMQNEPLLIQSRSVEALHQSRVALRRLRSAISLFRPVVADEQLEPLKARLRNLAAPLGVARDLDVFLARLLNTKDDHGSALAAQVRAERETAYDTVIVALQSPDESRLMFDLAAWVEAGPWTGAENPLRDQPVLVYAAGALDRRQRKLRREGRHLTELSPEARHEVRIAGKKLRYAVEFFSALYSEKRERRRLRAYVAALKALQEELGELNDIATAQLLAERLAHTTTKGGSPKQRRDLIFAAGREAGRRQGEIDDRLRKAAAAFGRFLEAKRFWTRADD